MFFPQTFFSSAGTQPAWVADETPTKKNEHVDLCPGEKHGRVESFFLLRGPAGAPVLGEGEDPGQKSLIFSERGDTAPGAWAGGGGRWLRARDFFFEQRIF